ncbi:uncharacterized protein LOC136035056 [Artemia franciscana]|uniref:uncharacterized protein LOC136035056 n=1 Tax=Artemia franciscana TaxID=6661 RepID=UPI0032DA58D4
MLSYNQCPHRSQSNLSALEVHHSNNTLDIFLKQYSNEKVVKNKFNVGDTVRINRKTNIFEKGNYLRSTELFKVSKVLDTKPVTYRLPFMKDDKILGSFYVYELQEGKNNGKYQIGNKLKGRTCKNKRQLLVRRLGYNSDFNSLAAAEDVHNA